MPSADVIIVNRLGLHARPSAKVSQTAGRFISDVWLVRNGRRVNAKSILGVMMLAAGQGATLRIETEGKDADEALRALKDLVASGFGEE